MMRINDIISKGGVISIYPEGMSSINGANQPVAIGTGNFLKKLGVPVFYSVIKGGYLSCPKYNVTDRPGRVESYLDLLLTSEDLKRMEPEEIEDYVNRHIYHDDYEWNLKKKYHYKTNGKAAEGLETLLYWCPKCHQEFVMRSKGDTIYCINCGNGATLDDTYEMHPLSKDCVIPHTQTKRHRMQRNLIREILIANPDYELNTKVQIGTLPDYELLKNKATSEIVGEGTLTLNKTGLTYKGSKKGEEVELFLPISKLPSYGMCTDVTRFYTFFDGEFVEFYPEHNEVAKWFLVTEELHRLNGGKWQDFKFNVNDIDNN